jgi:hypothetical protein
MVLAIPKPCHARAKGAAEYDFEFYMRNLIQGNNPREGNIQPTLPPPLPPPRKLGLNHGTRTPSLNRQLVVFPQVILNDELNGDCITLRTLSQITNVPVVSIAERIRNFRKKVAPAFVVRARWLEESMTDEYYFDLTCYSLYRTAADLMSNDYKTRNEWVQSLGKELYDGMNLQRRYDQPHSVVKLTETIPIMERILKEFQSNNFITSYRLGDDKNDDLRTGSNVFDVYDDQDIESGLSINCLVTLLKPATLTSSLQIVGEGSRFIPEFIGTTIAAMWRKEMGLKVQYETYFVDEEYRPNPKDYFPSEQLLQFTISKS